MPLFTVPQFTNKWKFMHACHILHCSLSFLPYLVKWMNKEPLSVYLHSLIDKLHNEMIFLPICLYCIYNTILHLLLLIVCHCTIQGVFTKQEITIWDLIGKLLCSLFIGPVHKAYQSWSDSSSKRWSSLFIIWIPDLSALWAHTK